MKKLVICLSVFLLIVGCAGTSKFYSLPESREYIHHQFNDSLFAHAHWGVLIESLTSGETWYELNADRMFMPASNEKIPTAASALLTLGPDFTFETHLFYTGEVVDSVLKGDLIVWGNGDPTFYTRVFDDPRDPFYLWADSLKKLGIKQIEGNIIGDDNAFDDQGYGYGWPLNNLDAWYSAESGALQFNENYVDLYIVQPANLEDSIKIFPNVESDYFTVSQSITITDTGRTWLRVDRPYGANQIYVTGTLKTGSDTLERSVSIWNPTLFYTTVLKETFNNKGILVTGNAIDCDDIPNWHIDSLNVKYILTHYSPPLSEILKLLMKKSLNYYAETMVKLLGWNEGGIGSFEEGKKVVERVMSDLGIEPESYAYSDGSGLSRYNYISPRQIVKILKGMEKSDYWSTWYEILPIAGVDGTLRRRMKGTKAEGNVRAKTGTISNVRGLSGYVTTADGEEIVFSFLVNGHLLSSRDTELITDSVLELIAEYPYFSEKQNE